LPGKAFFVEVKNGLRKERSEKHRQNTQAIDELCGTNGVNGTIHQAYVNMKAAEENTKHARAECIQAFEDHFANLTRGPDEKILYLAFDCAEWKQAKNGFDVSLQRKISAAKEFDHLNALHANLVICQNDVVASLEDSKLSADAEELCQRIRIFYDWLGSAP
jgi:hypothetical protein